MRVLYAGLVICFLKTWVEVFLNAPTCLACENIPKIEAYSQTFSGCTSVNNLYMGCLTHWCLHRYFESVLCAMQLFFHWNVIEFDMKEEDNMRTTNFPINIEIQAKNLCDGFLKDDLVSWVKMVPRQQPSYWSFVGPANKQAVIWETCDFKAGSACEKCGWRYSDQHFIWGTLLNKTWCNASSGVDLRRLKG